MSRLPIRVRLTLAFSVAFAVLLVVVGGFAYVRLAAGLSDDLDRELAQRAQDLMAPVRDSRSALNDLATKEFVEHGESFAELVTSDGRVLQATDTLDGEPLLTPDEAATASNETILLDRPSAPGLNEPARLLATPVTRGGRTEILVVGITRENGFEALRRVRAEMVIGLPLLLLLTSAGGYFLAGAALRPVEAMRRRAALMTAGAAGQRLPLPPGNDAVARLGATLNDMLARVDATLERERAFVANASHELRTPLALVRTELELAVRRPRPAARLTAAIHSATDEVDRLIRLAEDLLLLANADDSGPRVMPGHVDMAPFLAGIAARFHHLAERGGRTITVEPGDVTTVTADRHRLEQALLNLVANALQHGGGDIAILALSVGPGVQIHVTDEGLGLTDDMLEHGFERFAHARSGGGTGLGLSVVAAVAEAHGGSAEVVNQTSGGADAWITLPARTNPVRVPLLQV